MAEASGDGSYQKLIRNVYGSKTGIFTQHQYSEYSKIVVISSVIVNRQLSFHWAGWYHYTGNLLSRKSGGLLWHKYGDLNYYEYFVLVSVFDNRGQGYSLRCVAKFPIGEMDGWLVFL